MFTFKLKQIIPILAVILTVSVFFVQNTAYAKGEVYSYDQGKNETALTGSGGWFDNNYIHNKFTKTDEIDPPRSYNSVLTNAPVSDPFKNGGACFIALAVNTDTDKFMVMSNSVCQGGQTALEDQDYAISGSINNPAGSGGTAPTVDTPEKMQKQIDAVYSVLGPSLEGVKATYYREVLGSKAPCNAQGCNDTLWKAMVYECWNTSRNNAASTARLTEANGGTYDLNAGTKDLFSRCLSGKVSNKPPQAAINAAITGIDSANVNKATDDAGAAYDEGVENANNAQADESAPTCQVEGIGWIVCPVMLFMGGIVDGAYSFIANLLQVKPLLTTGDTEGIYNAWTIMRNIANVAFVIAFLIIIFSQLTSVGVSNYGVKKLLPRLVIAAILVNASYWVCSIAVDLSNIIGGSIRVAFDTIGASIPTAANFSSGDIAGENWQGLVGIILAISAGAALYVGLSALIPALLAALLAVVTVFLVLTLRQALIIILIVVSPLAFVAFLLPNTEDLFTKWRKLLTTLLLMYPIIAGIFGASALASKIIMNAAEGDTAIQVMGALIAILPLALTPLVMKTAGGLLNRFGGIVNNVDKGPFDRMKKGGEDLRKNRQNLRNMRALNGAGQFGRGSVIRWNARRKAVNSGRETEMNRANTEYMADQLQNNSSLRNKVAGGTALNPADQSGAQRALANAINTNLKLEADEVNAAKAVIENANLSGAERQTLATTGSLTKNGTKYSGDTMQKAAIQEQLRTGSMNDIHKIVENSGGSLSNFKQTIAQGVASNGVASKNPALGGKTLDAIAQGRIKSESDLNATMLGAMAEGKFTAEAMASMHDDVRERAINLAQTENAAGNATYIRGLREARDAISSSSELSAKVSGNDRAKTQLGSL